MVRLFREVVGRDPHADEAFRDTAQLRSGVTEQRLRNALVDSDEAKSSLTRVYREVLATEPSMGELARWRSFLRRGGTYEQFVTRLAR